MNEEMAKIQARVDEIKAMLDDTKDAIRPWQAFHGRGFDRRLLRLLDEARPAIEFLLSECVRRSEVLRQNEKAFDFIARRNCGWILANNIATAAALAKAFEAGKGK